MVTKRTSSRTKAQLLEELEDLKDRLSEKAELDPTTVASAKKRETTVITNVGKPTPQDIVDQLGRLGVMSQNALDGIKQQMVNAAAELAELREAVEITKAELEELHDKEIVASSVADLIVEIENRTEQFEADIAERQRLFDSQLFESKRVEAERKSALEKERVREADEFEYKKAQERRAAEDKFQQKMITTDRAYADKLLALQKDWQTREDNILTQETEIVAMREQIAAFPVQLEEAKKKATDTLARAMSSEYGHKAALAEAAANSAKALAEAEIKSLRQKTSDQDIVITTLQAKLEAAEKRVESIANNALASASGRQALEAANSMASTLKDGASRKS